MNGHNTLDRNKGKERVGAIWNGCPIILKPRNKWFRFSKIIPKTPAHNRYPNQMKSQHILIILGVLVAGILFYTGYWLYTHFERYSEIVEIGFQGEARDNPLLAAERLLERMGTAAETIPSFPNIEEDLSFQDTLILAQYGHILNEEQTQQLFSWIDGGGHLIMSSHSTADILGKITKTVPDPLLSDLEVSRHQNGLDDSDRAKVPPTEFWWAQYRLQVAFNPEYYIEANTYEPAREISDKYGTHFLFYYYGSGIISILSDLAFIENDRIGDYDHAQFLWQLVHFEHTLAQVWLLRMQAESEGGSGKDKIPPLWTLLWRELWTMIIVAAILLLFWIWTASRRFGPLLPEPPRTRRRLLEHIEASGHFLWRQDQAHTLLHGARQAVLKRIESVHPDWTRLSHTQLSQRLAQIGELPASEIETALYGSKPDTEIAFTRTLQILSQIRKTL